MSVPSNLVPTRILQLPEDPSPSNTGWMMYVNNGVTYKVQVNAVLNVSGVPSTRQINAGTGLTGGGDLSQNRTLSVAPGGIGSTELDNTGVTSGTYGSNTEIPVVTVDANGRITSMTTAGITVSGYVPTSTQVIAGTGLTGGGALNTNVTLNANLSDSSPVDFGTASPGVSTSISRSDHVHPAVNLTDLSQTEGVLDITRGGTGNELTAPAIGGIVYSDGTQLDVTESGTAGDVLVSNGFAPPNWVHLGTIAYQDYDAVNITGGTITGVTVNGTAIDLANQGLLKFYELTANGTNYVALRAPASLSGNTTYTLPSADGLSGQFLTTDGTGALSWSTPVGAGDVSGPASSTDDAIVRFNGTTGKVIQNSGVIIDDSNNVTLQTEGSLRLADNDSTNYVGFKAPSVVASNVTWTLPATDGTNGQALKTNGSGTLSWQSYAAAGANSDITSMSGLTGGISTPDYIQFDSTLSPLPTDATAKLYYDNSDQFQTLVFQMNGSVVQKIGEEQYFRVKCSSAVTKGQVVMFTGTLGASGGLTAAPATGLTADQANYILGVAAESGVTNDWIFVTFFGEVKNINTTGGAESWTQGQVLYYDPTVTGGLTKNKPTTPNAIAVMAAVVNVGSSNGILFVRPTYGSVLGGTDGNVQFGTLNNGDVIVYDSVDQRWENRAQSTLTAGTATNVAGGGANQIVYNTASGTSSFITAPTVANTYLEWSGSAFQWSANPLGTVTSVGLALPSEFTISNSPVTTSGTLTGAWASQTANYFLAAPNGSPGTPSFRAIVAADIPTLNQNTTGSAGSVANAVTFTNTGGGAAGTTFNGSTAVTIDYSTVGAPKADGTGASGTWGISISGTATNATNVAVTADATNTDRYLAFLSATTGNNGVLADTDLKYNPSTNALTAGSYFGDISNCTGTLNGGTY